MFRVNLYHALCEKSFSTLIQDILSTHATTHHIEHHVFSTNSLIVSLTHESAHQLYFLFIHSKLGSDGIRSDLSYSLQYFITISTDVQLLTMLKKTVIVLETFFRSIADRTIHQLDSSLQVGFIFLQTRTINPVQSNIRSVGSGPFCRVSSILTYALQNSIFQFLRNQLLSYTHLHEKYTQLLRLRNLIIPPVRAIRVAHLPVLQAFYYLFVNSVITVICVIGICVGESEIAQTLHVYNRHPVSAVDTGIVDIRKTTVLRIIQRKFFLYSLRLRIVTDIFAYLVHEHSKVVYRINCLCRQCGSYKEQAYHNLLHYFIHILHFKFLISNSHDYNPGSTGFSSGNNGL